jgi:FkbM family methyltransferase
MHGSKISTDMELSEQVPIRPLRGGRLVRFLNIFLRLNRMWHPALSCFNKSRDLVVFPFAGTELVHPAAWRKELTAYFLAGEDTVPEFRLMRKLCHDLGPGTVVDVGANMGLYVVLARTVTQHPIVAFEPVPFLFDLMRRNILHNGIKNIDTHRMACGAEPGVVSLAAHMNASIVPGTLAATAKPSTGDFNADAQAARSEDRLAEAPLTTLDEAMGNRPVALLKIDCEGYELDVLRGVRGILERDKPRLFIEVHPALIGRYGGTPQALLDFLSPYYRMEFWDFEQARHVSKLIRSWRKHRPNPGLRLPNAASFLDACKNSPLPVQLYLVAYPRG